MGNNTGTILRLVASLALVVLIVGALLVTPRIIYRDKPAAKPVPTLTTAPTRLVTSGSTPLAQTVCGNGNCAECDYRYGLSVDGRCYPMTGMVTPGTSGTDSTWSDGSQANGDCDASGRHCDPVAESVEAVMQRRFGDLSDYSPGSVWINGDYGTAGVRKYEGALARLRKVERWAKTLPPGETRSAYLAVTEAYEGAVDEALGEIKDLKMQKEMAEYQRRQAECDRIARQYRHSHKLPEPPQ